jgi:hypothetical protein
MPPTPLVPTTWVLSAAIGNERPTTYSARQQE